MPTPRRSLPDKPYREFTQSEAGTAITLSQAPEGRENRLFIEGDHWQGGAGWVGPRPQAGEAGSEVVMAEIQKGFTSRNAVLEVTDRHTQGVVGREPAWGFVVARDMEDDEEPTEAEQGQIDEAEALLTEWWNTRNIAQLLQNAVATSLHQERGLLRVYIPRGLLVTRETQGADGVVRSAQVATAKDIKEALDLIYVDAPHPETAVVLEDPSDMQPVSMHNFSVGNKRFSDICYIDVPTGKTVLRRVGTGISDAEGEVHSWELGGRLLMHQLERRLLISKQVQQQQRALNLAESMIPRNVVTGGFLERIITNAKMPGRYVDDPDAEDGTGRTWVPFDFYTGAGTTNVLSGITVTDREGNESLTSPGITFREPVSPKASIEAREAHYASILNEADQLHHLISSDAVASAVSRVEARLDFVMSLKATQAPLEAMGRWLIETVLALAETVAGKEGEFTEDLRADFTCRLQAGTLTAEEQTVIVERVEKGLLDRETAMSMLGVDDVDAAIQRINAQPGSMLAMRQQQAEVVAAWINAGVTIDVAAQLAGFDKDSDEYKLLSAPVDPTKTRVVTQ